MAIQTNSYYTKQSTKNHKASPRVLVVDDDEDILDLISEILIDSGFEIVVSQDSDQAVQIINTENIDLVILDLEIHGKDGFAVLGEIRSFSLIPIIILSGRKQTQVIVACLSIGADDYITKPFANNELVARCLTALRHQRNVATPLSLTVGEVHLDLNKREAVVSGLRTNLTRYEYELLKELMINAGIVVHYDQLIRKVWGVKDFIPKDYIHVYIGRLRSKLKVSPDIPVNIEAVRGIGYLFRD